MTTTTQAYAAIRDRLESQITAVPLRWQNEDSNPLEDSPTSFIYVEFLTERAFIASYGGGRGSNRYRNVARVDAYVFVPRGVGLSVATDLAETVAAALRSYRTADVSCFDASTRPGGNGSDITPPGLSSEVDNYFWAMAEASLYFDQTG